MDGRSVSSGWQEVPAKPTAWYRRSMEPTGASQLDKFKEADRQLETDEDPNRFRERLAGLVKDKPVEDKPQ